VRCGMCVQTARNEGAPLGLTFVDRGFDVRVSVPLGESLEQGLKEVAQKTVGICPTGALGLEHDEDHERARKAMRDLGDWPWEV